MNNGKLIVNIYNSTIGNSLKEVLIKVLSDNEIIREYFTDESGKAEISDLPAPPIEYSLEFDENKEQPYSKYNLEITKQNFISKRINGIEILQNTTAIQNVILEPTNENNSFTEVIQIEEHTLYAGTEGKLPEEEVKNMPQSNGFVVLDNPTIPETIIVHDGVPDDASAIDYYVPFKDYINNVASSEIYATWPIETIRANVLVILSFTLNRVYTEWYRGRGYSFTITSSSVYDQKYTHGRNTYEEISTVVDEFFTRYITRPNIVQPLLTQYCDGRISQCPNWLSQWGSKTLGDQGYSYTGIIKRYYGQDVYIDTATRVQGVPMSYPGHTLQLNSREENVRIIQSQLNAISNNYPAIPKIDVDGIFGPKTQNAVTTFQKTFDMPQTGVVNLATWYKISYIFVAVRKLAS